MLTHAALCICFLDTIASLMFMHAKVLRSQLSSVRQCVCTSPRPSSESESFRVSVCHVSAVCMSMCLLMTCHYHQGKSSDEASETTLVNLKEFNKLAAHGSESKLQLSITGYYIAHIKTPTLDNMHGRNTTSHTRLQTHKCSKT